MKIISRAEAKAAGLKRYFTGASCKHGHVSQRYVSTGGCAECLLSNAAEWRSKNPEKVKAYNAATYNADPTARRERSRIWRENNPDKVVEYSRRWYARNTERAAASYRKWCDANHEYNLARRRRWHQANPERARELNARHRRENPGLHLAKSARRRAMKLQRTPTWCSSIALQKVYSEAADRRANGEDVHVDHIIPLQGELVSGLHVPENLQIIPAAENLSKSNRFDVERQCA